MNLAGLIGGLLTGGVQGYDYMQQLALKKQQMALDKDKAQTAKANIDTDNNRQHAQAVQALADKGFKPGAVPQVGLMTQQDPFAQDGLSGGQPPSTTPDAPNQMTDSDFNAVTGQGVTPVDNPGYTPDDATALGQGVGYIPNNPELDRQKAALGVIQKKQTEDDNTATVRAANLGDQDAQARAQALNLGGYGSAAARSIELNKGTLWNPRTGAGRTVGAVTPAKRAAAVNQLTHDTVARIRNETGNTTGVISPQDLAQYAQTHPDLDARANAVKMSMGDWANTGSTSQINLKPRKANVLDQVFGGGGAATPAPAVVNGRPVTPSGQPQPIAKPALTDSGATPVTPSPAAAPGPVNPTRLANAKAILASPAGKSPALVQLAQQYVNLYPGQ